jgi:anti-sigma B factor antagonist
MMPQLGMSATVDGEWGVLVVSGEVDLAVAPELRASLAELVDVGVRHLVVDLRPVTFLDSTGIGVLVAAAKRLHDADVTGSLRLVCTDERVLRVLRLTGVLAVFLLHATVDQARAAEGHPAADPASEERGG